MCRMYKKMCFLLFICSLNRKFAARRNNMKKDSIIILSGGMDSTTLLYDQQQRIALAISYDYGSNHNAKEIPFAQWHCKQLGIEHIVIPLDS